MKYYIKKLTENELGYRKGKLTNGQMFYISKQASVFFPPLSRNINNDSVQIEINVEYRSNPVYVNLIYHNDKYNREKGTRDEYRIYLNRELAPDDFYFRPEDIILFERIGDKMYILKRFREGNTEYEQLNKIIEKSKMRGRHAITDFLNI